MTILLDRYWSSVSARYQSLFGLATFSALVTALGVLIAYRVELVLLSATTSRLWMWLAGFIEEAFVRLLPLILVFYVWSYARDRLLSKTEGLLATVASGLTVGGLELVLKLEYLSRLERTAQFDSILLPLLFVHLPFALLAGRFVYTLGERIHGTDTVGLPSLSRRTLGLLLGGYLVLGLAHVVFNLLI